MSNRNFHSNVNVLGTSQYLDVLSGEIEKNLYKICILYNIQILYRFFSNIQILYRFFSISSNKTSRYRKICILYIYIYIVHRFYTDFSLFRQIKRQDTVGRYCKQFLTSLYRSTLFGIFLKPDSKQTYLQVEQRQLS